MAVGTPAFAQAERASATPAAPAQPPSRQARTIPLFRSPEGFPNGLAAGENGLWIAEQKRADGPDSGEKAMLVDWSSGRLLRTVVTRARNTSGIAWDGSSIWMGCNGGPQGFYRTALDNRVLAHRQIPLGAADNGGGCHGALYREGKFWIVANRLRGILRVDAESFAPEFMIPIAHGALARHRLGRGRDLDGDGHIEPHSRESAGPGQVSTQRPDACWRRWRSSRAAPTRTASRCMTAFSTPATPASARASSPPKARPHVSSAASNSCKEQSVASSSRE